MRRSRDESSICVLAHSVRAAVAALVSGILLYEEAGRMSEEFAESIIKDYLVMLDCSSRRSIIRSVSEAKKRGLGEYSNKRWTIRYLGTNDYEVIENKTGTKYLVKDSEDAFMGTHGFSVYKRRREE